MSTARFSKSLTSVSANNIVTLLDLPQELAYYEQFKADNIVDHSIVLEDLQCKVGLFTLLEADWPNENALASESAMEAARAKILKEGQKIYLELYIAKGNGPWELQGEEILQNKNGLEQPWALMAPWFSTNETALLGEDLKIGVKIANKAQGVGGLKGSDYLRIFGTWRKQTRIELKKKDSGVEALNDRISALETLLNVYGAPSANLPGTNGLVPAPPAGSGEFLLRGDRAWQNPNEFATPAQITAFASTMTNALAQKVGTIGNEIIAGSKTFADAVRITNTTQSTSTTTGAHIIDGGQAVGGNLNVGGFTSLGDNVGLKCKILSFTSPTVDSNTVLLNGQLPAMDKIVSLTGWLQSAETDWYPPSFFSIAKQYTNWWSIYSWAGGLYINLHTNALAKMGGQPGKMIVTYIA